MTSFSPSKPAMRSWLSTLFGLVFLSRSHEDAEIEPEPLLDGFHASRDPVVLRAICLFSIALVIVTWQLWQPQTVFPQVPLLAAAIHWPDWVDRVSTPALLSALIATFVFAQSGLVRRFSLVAAIGFMIVLCVADQHRLQPWAYHFMICAWVFVACSAPRNLRWLRLLVVSVYLCSAFSKFDTRFLETNGTLFVQTWRQMIGWNGDPVSPAFLARWALLLPLGELAMAALLSVRGLRRIGVLAAVILHLMLIILLSPWGLNHRWGVLIWNVAFLTQVVLLFWPLPPRAASQSDSANVLTWWPPSWSARIMLVPVLLAILLPWTEPMGLWDSWLSWGLYSTRASKVEIFVSRDSVEQLPQPMRTFCVGADPESFWVRLAMDRWSLETLQAPIYPHERFQLGVALAVCESIPSTQRWVMAVRSSAPNRRTGAVTTQQWWGEDELKRLTTRYKWNAMPRSRSSLLITPVHDANH